MIMYADGGSIALEFRNEDGESSLLIIDRHYYSEQSFDAHGFPTREYFELKRNEDDLLYWGEDNFVRKAPLRSGDPVCRELHRAIEQWIAADPGRSDDEHIVTFQERLKRMLFPGVSAEVDEEEDDPAPRVDLE